MKKLIVLILLMFASITYGIESLDVTHTWIVAKNGNDGNAGHPTAYPIVTSGNAFLTIGQAVSSASSGDTIIVFPGTYDETVDIDTAGIGLHLIGTNRDGCIIFPSTGGGHGIATESNCTFENLTIKGGSGSSARGIAGAGKSNITIKNCYIEATSTTGAVDGASFTSGSKIFVYDSIVISTYDGLTLGGVSGFVVDNCYIKTSGGVSVSSKALYLGSSGFGSVSNCTCIAEKGTADYDRYAGYISGPVSVSNCNFSCLIAGGSGDAYGVYAVGSSVYGFPVFVNCNMGGFSTEASYYGINVGTSSYAYLTNTYYSSSGGAGTIREQLRPTTAGRTLDVAATGEAGLDFDNIKDATGAHTLTNITVPTVTTVGTLTTYTGNTPQTGDSFARLGAPAGASISADIVAVKSDTGAILTDTAAYDTDAEYAAAIWNAATASYGSAGTYGLSVETIENYTDKIDDAYYGLTSIRSTLDGVVSTQGGHTTSLSSLGSQLDTIEADTEAMDTSGELRTLLTGADTPVAKGTDVTTAHSTTDSYIDTEITTLYDIIKSGGTGDPNAIWTIAKAVQAKTDNLPTDPADDSDLDTQLIAIQHNLNTNIFWDANAAVIVDEFETQSQADPTGFHVNIKEINGTAQTAGDVVALANSSAAWGYINSGIVFRGIVSAADPGVSFTIGGLADQGVGAFIDSGTPWYAYVFRDAGGAGAAPQGEAQEVTGYTSATGLFTTEAFTSSVGVGDDIIIMSYRIAAVPEIKTVVDDILVDTGTTLDDLVDDLESRLTATRAGYLDYINTIYGKMPSTSYLFGSSVAGDDANSLWGDIVTIGAISDINDMWGDISDIATSGGVPVIR